MTTVTGTISTNQIEGYIESVSRTQQLCNPMQILELGLSEEAPYNVVPSQQVILFENGTRVFTGYVIKVTRERPDYNWMIECHDAYTRCQNYFIDQKITIGYDDNDQPIPGYQPQSTDYWIGYLCGLAGIDFQIDSGSNLPVPTGVQIGLRTVHEALTDIIAFSSQYMRVDSNGVLRFSQVRRNRADMTITNPISIEDTTSDEWTRNRAKVYGYNGVRSRVFSNQSVSIPNISPDRITVVSNPMIQTQAEADRVGSYLLGELGNLSRIVTARIQGNPSIHVGQVARINSQGTNHIDTITTCVHRINEKDGHITDVTIGERCPRISGWSILAPVYAGTSSEGVYRSLNGGQSWSPFNVGLPSGSKYVSRIATNPDLDSMAIVNNSLFYNDGLTDDWIPRSLPAPINSAGDSPAPNYGRLVAVSAGQLLGKFFVLTTNQRSSGSTQQNSRAWLYTTLNSGVSWSSVQMYDSDVTTGSGYTFYGLDLSSEAGVPYIIGTSGSIYNEFVKGSMQRTGYRNTLGSDFCDPLGNRGLIDYDLKSMSVTGSGASQVLNLVFRVKYDIAPSTKFLYYRIFDDALGIYLISIGPYPIAGLNVVNFSGSDEVGVTIPYRANPFTVGFGFDSTTTSGFDTWYIQNGGAFTCDELINASPLRHFLTCGFLSYQFS